MLKNVPDFLTSCRCLKDIVAKSRKCDAHAGIRKPLSSLNLLTLLDKLNILLAFSISFKQGVTLSFSIKTRLSCSKLVIPCHVTSSAIPVKPRKLGR